MIPDLFFNVMSSVFDFDFPKYLAEKGRGFCAVSMLSQSSGLKLVSHLGLDSKAAQALLTAVEGRGLIKATGGYYAYEDRCGHEDQWYALVVAAAGRMQKQYPHLFKNVRDVVETALYDDWNKEPMDCVDWPSLEATP